MHTAIVNHDLDMVKELVSNGASVNQRACGRYFLPTDQKYNITGDTNYKGAIHRNKTIKSKKTST